MSTDHPNQNVFQTLAQHFPSVPTGILVTNAKPLERLTGTVTAEAWLSAYRVLLGAQVGAGTLPDLEPLLARARTYVDEGKVPIAILDVRYDALKPSYLRQVQGYISREQEIPAPANTTDALTFDRVFAACALLPLTYDVVSVQETVFPTKFVTFVLDPAFVLTIGAPAPEAIEIDLGDGQGPRRLPMGGEISTQYDAETFKPVITIEYAGADGLRLESTTTLTLAEPKPLMVAQASTVWRDIKGENGLAGDAFVHLGSGNPALRKPLLIVQGLDPNTASTDTRAQWLYDAMNAKFGYLDNVRARGYDVILLIFKTNTAAIQDNAAVVRACINKIKQERVGNEQLVVCGLSMGGLIARYALCQMTPEQHQTRVYVSYDSPHGGAHIPIPLQFLLYYYSEDSEPARAGNDLMKTPACRSMLRHSYHFPEGEDFKKLMSDFQKVGNWPKGCKLIAVSNGVNSKGYTINPGENLIDWHGNGLVWAWANAEPEHAGGTKAGRAFKIGYRIWDYWVPDMVGLTGWPGGTRDTHITVAQGFQATGYGWVDWNHKQHCFIPTFSALGLTEPWIPVQREMSPFHDFYTCSQNEPHCAINDSIIHFLNTYI